MKMFYLTRTIFCLIIVLVVCFTLSIPVSISFAESAQPQKDKPQYVLRIGTIMPAGVSYMKYIEKEMRERETSIDHRLKFELYSGGELGDELAMVKMVQNGELDGAVVTSSGLENVVPESRILSLPFLCRDEYEMEFILEKYESIFAEHARKRGIGMLMLLTVGCSPIYSTVPLSGPGDMLEKKIMCIGKSGITRCANDFSIPLSLSDMESALSKGEVEVVFGPPAFVVVMGWYPYIQYVYMTCFSSAIGAVIVNLDRYQHLPEDIRSVFTELIPKQKKISLKRIRRDNEIAMLGLMKRGVKIIQIPPEVIARARDDMKAHWNSGVGKWYPRELLDDILRDLEAYRAGEVTMENKN